MAVGLAASVANGFLNALARATNYTAPLAFYIQLHIGDPGAAGTANPAGNTTRKQVTFGSAASGGSLSNTVAASWAGAEVAASEDYTHWSAWDASTAGSFLASGTLTANPVTAGDQFTMAIGQITLSLNVAA